MKKKHLAVGAFVCLTLTLAAVALPMVTKVSANQVMKKVQTKETPEQYTEDFVIEEEAVMPEEIIITEGQLKPFIEIAKKEFAGLGITIPEDIKAEYLANVDDKSGMNVDVFWPDLGERLMDYSSSFINVDIENGEGTLTIIRAERGLDISLVNNLKETALEQFKEKLGMTIPEGFVAYASVTKGFPSKPDSLMVTINWRDPLETEMLRDPLYTGSTKSFAEYSAGFVNVNIEEQSGELVNMFKEGRFSMQQEKLPRTATFTEEEIQAMLDTAKAFAEKNNIFVGDMINSRGYNTAGSEGMQFQFDTQAKNGYDCPASIMVSSDLKIFGYSIYI